jgi:regulator of protease activity HflC (stomatin/prohibitin superfamily)
MNGRNETSSIATAIVVAASFVLVLVVGCAGCSQVGPGHVGIVVSKVGSSRGVQDVTIKTGWVLVNPITTTVIEYPVFMQTVKWTKSPSEGSPNDESITFTTGDQMVVNADISLSYQLEFDKTPAFYVKFRADKIQDFTDGFLRNVARNSFNAIAGGYQIGDIMGNNGPVLKKIQDDMQRQLSPYGVQIDQLGFIGAPRPPETVTDSINLKARAEQIALTKQIELTQVQADAAKEVARAKGDAAANIERAQADATANKLRSESLTPALVEWTAIQKWDGHRPQVEGAGAGILMNMQGGR